MGRGPKWTTQEHDFLEERLRNNRSYNMLVKEFKQKAIFKTPGFHERSYNSIKAQARLMGLNGRLPKPGRAGTRWSGDEIRTLIKYVNKGYTTEGIQPFLPGRSAAAINVMKSKLGITPIKRERKHHNWLVKRLRGLINV